MTDFNGGAVEDRVRFFLGAHRPKEALAAVDQALAASPSDPMLHTLRAECHLSVRDTDAAEAALEAAMALGVPSLDTLAIATRVALVAGRFPLATRRAQSYVAVAPLHPHAWYLTALVAAHSRDEQLCDEAIEQCKELRPGDVLWRYARLESAIILGGRRRLRDARVQADRLVGDHPADGQARRLAASLARRSSPFSRSAADSELRHLAAGAALGVPPQPGQLRAAVERALGPTLVALSWFGVVIGIQAVAIQTWWPAAVCAPVWCLWIAIRGRQSGASIARLPAAGRRRVALPAISVNIWLGLAGILIGAAIVGYLAPWDQARAVALELGHDKDATVQQVVTRPPITFPPPLATFPDLTSPLGTFPPLTIPASPDDNESGPVETFPTLTFPPLTAPPVYIPPVTVPPIPQIDIITVRRPIDADRAYAMLKQMTTTGSATVAVGASMLLLGVWQRRLLRQKSSS